MKSFGLIFSKSGRLNRNWLKILFLASIFAAIVPRVALCATSGSIVEAMTPINLGSQTAGGGAVSFDTIEAPASAQGCNYPAYYIDLTTVGGRGIYAELLGAKLSGQKIARIDWAMNAGTTICLVNYLQLQN